MIKKFFSLALFSISIFFLLFSLESLGKFPFPSGFYQFFALFILSLFLALFLVRFRFNDSLKWSPFPRLQFSFLPTGIAFILLGILFNLTSFCLHLKYDFSLPTSQTDLATLSYLFSLIFLTVGAWLSGRKEKTRKGGLKRKERFILVALVVVAVLIRFYKLNSIGHLPEDWGVPRILRTYSK